MLVNTHLVNIFDHMEKCQLAYVCRTMDEGYKSCGTAIFTGDLNIKTNKPTHVS